MPVYEYRCEECGNIHAEIRDISLRKEPGKTCECGGETKLVISRPSRFQRGPGWRSRMEAEMPGEI